MIFNETYVLSNGVKIPKLALGTWLIDNADAKKAVKDAVSLGYRHIDTAQAYGNEKGIGAGIRSCGVDRGVDRKDIFVTTKVAAENKTYESAMTSIDLSLEKLGVDYIDLVIIHSPQPWAEFRNADNRYFDENKSVWKALEDAYKAGKARAIGISNFLVDDIESLLPSCEIKPMVNQILAHASNTPFELIDYCKNNDILVEAYSPIAHGAVLENKKIIETAMKYNASPAQLCLKYDLQLGMVVLPKASTQEHMKENGELDFVINDEDMDMLKSLEHIKDYGKDGFFPVFSVNR